jgi:carboxylesterase type B
MTLQSLIPSLLLALGQTIAALPGKSYSLLQGPVVNIASGAVQGTINSSFPHVEQYRSIPFAVPPLGDLRFAPPQKIGLLGFINATHEPPSCPQYVGKLDIFGILVPQINTIDNFSEDCLLLNVYKPAGQQKKKLPVLIWIFGGGFSVGGINTLYSDPKPLLERRQDLVIVKINYMSQSSITAVLKDFSL